MKRAALIPADTFCTHHHIEFSFIRSLQQYGLIEVIMEDETAFIPEGKINELEKFARWYHELDINLAGIDAITHLLQRVQNMQAEITGLRNRLSLYEPGD